MKATVAMKQAVISGAVFAGVLAALVSVDDRVQERFADLVAGHDNVSSFTARASQLGDALATAVRHQSIDNAPMVVFATVGIVLVVFMVRT